MKSSAPSTESDFHGFASPSGECQPSFSLAILDYELHRTWLRCGSGVFGVAEER
jgi:hypothetical protein